MDNILDLPDEQSAFEPNYAGFWIRVIAIFIDGIIIGIPILIVTALSDYFKGDMEFIPMLLLVFGIVLYFAVLDSSQYQGTLGKLAVGIKIVDRDGNRISFGRAIGRFFSRILSQSFLYIGYIMVAFDSRKQGLHDKIAGTFVIYR